MNGWLRINQVLTPRRMSYAWIAGGALWFAWLLSILAGPGNMDLAGQVIGTDYLQFYTSGVTMRAEQSANLYNFEYQSQLEQSIAGPGLISFHAFITPPFFAWLFLPLSMVPYSISFIIWSLFGFIFLWTSLILLSAKHPFRAFLWSLTWFPIFAAISFGQNSLLSLFLLSLTYWLWRKEKYLLAGLAISLLLYKPQLILGVGFLWLLEWRRSWKSLLGLFLGGISLAGLCFIFMPEASRAYIDLARNILPDMIYSDQFPLWHMHSLRGFWILLLPGQKWLVEGLSMLLSAAGIFAYTFFWRAIRKEPDMLFAGAICLTIWITPHAMIYDWSILLIPAILLWQARPEFKKILRPLFTLIWIVTLISGPLTYTLLQLLPIAIQISIPIFLIVILTINKMLSPHPQEKFADLK